MKVKWFKFVIRNGYKMKTITIPEVDYQMLQNKVSELENKLALLQDEQFIHKLQLAYQIFIYPKQTDSPKQTSLKRGSGKQITYIADDFSAPLDDFKDYM